jgi:hypothetical protein
VRPLWNCHFAETASQSAQKALCFDIVQRSHSPPPAALFDGEPASPILVLMSHGGPLSTKTRVVRLNGVGAPRTAGADLCVVGAGI